MARASEGPALPIRMYLIDLRLHFGSNAPGPIA